MLELFEKENFYVYEDEMKSGKGREIADIVE